MKVNKGAGRTITNWFENITKNVIEPIDFINKNENELTVHTCDDRIVQDIVRWNSVLILDMPWHVS